MAFEISTIAADYYQQRLLLDGKLFDVELYWNERDSRWYMTIYESSEPTQESGFRAALISSVPIVIGYPLLSQFKDRRRPLGDFLAYDKEGTKLPPGRRELGPDARVSLLYYSAADLDAIPFPRLADGPQTEP